MARIFTTPAAEAAAKRWLALVTIGGGLRTDPNLGDVGDARFKKCATAICDELVNRDFNNIDDSIKSIARYGFNIPGESKTRHLKPEQIAKCIVYMAERVQLYWDDTVRTPFEIDEFKKTLLGEAVYTYSRYISAIQDKPAKTRTNNAPGVASATGGTGVAGNKQPKNNYKQSGGQSANARDLKGQPGEKVYADTAFIYRIIGDKTGTNTPNVFVNPLSASGAVGTTNKVNFSSGNGYSDCTCFFDDQNDAQAFLNKIIKNNRVPVNVTNPRVVKGKADPNGYFIVGTEFGDCAISAKKLNEALGEAMKESATRQVDWKKATEGYTREEINELHTWMRRD